ncbi:MAG: diadenylate cyclase [Candidatus Spechtbacterales bacterium]|nr:diadenylate cyclase [Candidatus Spechtbacterales bacterium]
MQQFLANLNYLADTMELGENIYLTDILDIIIIAILIYVALFFLKQTRSLLAFIGVGVLLGLYVIAKFFGLFLTSIALQSFFSVFLIILAVVFQEELRRFFELIAALSTRQAKERPLTSSSAGVAALAQAVSYLSGEKEGALIVIRGQENLDRHLEGGETADAIISEQLLESLFDPSSGGHDGAIIIHKNRITRFGVHLPLSKNFNQIKKRGTRHSAGIGITEVSDALSIIVSEETGAISIAKNGKIKAISDAEDLQQEINKFLKDKFPENPPSIWENLVKKNSGIKLTAMGLAAFIWFFSVFQAEVIQRDFLIPVTYVNVAEDMIIQDYTPKEVSITLASRETTGFDKLAAEEITLTINGDLLKDGVNRIELKEEYIGRPFYVSVIDITPETLRINAKEYQIANNIAIEADTKGNLPEELTIDKISLTPSTLNILVPEGQKIPEQILTEPIDLSEITETTTLSLKPTLPSGMRLKKQSDVTITVTISVNKK